MQAKWITEIQRLISANALNLEKAGKILYDESQRNKNACAELIAATGYPRQRVEALYDIGSGAIDARAVMDYYPASSAVLKLSFANQKKVLDDGFAKVAVLDGEAAKVVQIPVKSMSTAEAALAFDRRDLRSSQAQIALLLAKRRAKPADGRYVTNGSLIKFNGWLEIAEVKQIIATL